ncbi:Uncharacterised protein [Vibrio cholerae]|nr:Uncharacterised protein [Vibrio cholerae]
MALHRCNHFITNHKAANIRTACFFDVLLHHDIGFESHERFNNTFRRSTGFCQYHADALCAF